MRRTFALSLAAGLFILAGRTAAQSVPPSSFSFFRQIIIDHRQVANSDQTDFPVLISLSLPDLATAANGGQVQNANGYDIAFTSDAAGQTQLDHEIDSYDPVTGNAAFWVRIPTLSHTTDTSVYMWYGSSAVVTSQQNKPGVWQAGYQSVYHFANASMLGSDSGSAGYGLSPTGTVGTVTGKIGGGVSFNGGNYLNHSSVNAFPSGTSAVTLESWIQTSGYASGEVVGYGSNSQTGARIGLYGDGSGNIYVEFDGISVSGSYPNDSRWHHLVGIYNGGSTARIYLDGEQVGSTTSLNTPAITTTELKIGGIPTVNWCCAFNGSVDEVRVLTGTLSADWIAAMHEGFEEVLTEQTGTQPGDWLMRTGPGETGVDATYIGPASRYPGFNYAELKPVGSSPTAIGNQIGNWGLPQGQTSIWLYNRGGIIGQSHGVF